MHGKSINERQDFTLRRESSVRFPLRREFNLSGFLESFMPPELIIACHKWAPIIQRGESRRANPASEEHQARRFLQSGVKLD